MAELWRGHGGGEESHLHAPFSSEALCGDPDLTPFGRVVFEMWSPGSQWIRSDI